MPNRTIRDTICADERLDALSPEAERLHHRLHSQCDDYGRFDGRASVIRSRCYQLCPESVALANVEGWLQKMAAADIILLYSVGGRRYLQMLVWPYAPRARQSKYPAPNSAEQVLADAKRVQADAEPPQADDEQTPAGSERVPAEDEHVLSGIGTDSRFPVSDSRVRVRTSKEGPPPPPDMSRYEREILRALHEIKDHVPDFEADLAHVRKWLVRFPSANLLDEIDRCETWWTGPKAPRGAGKANWRSRVRNWLQKQEEIREERNQKAPAPPRPKPFTPSQDTIDSIARAAHLDYGPRRPVHDEPAPADPPPEGGEPPA